MSLPDAVRDMPSFGVAFLSCILDVVPIAYILVRFIPGHRPCEEWIGKQFRSRAHTHTYTNENKAKNKANDSKAKHSSRVSHMTFAHIVYSKYVCYSDMQIVFERGSIVLSTHNNTYLWTLSGAMTHSDVTFVDVCIVRCPFRCFGCVRVCV